MRTSISRLLADEFWRQFCDRDSAARALDSRARAASARAVANEAWHLVGGCRGRRGWSAASAASILLSQCTSAWTTRSCGNPIATKFARAVGSGRCCACPDAEADAGAEALGCCAFPMCLTAGQDQNSMRIPHRYISVPGTRVRLCLCLLWCSLGSRVYFFFPAQPAREKSPPPPPPAYCHGTVAGSRWVGGGLLPCRLWRAVVRVRAPWTLQFEGRWRRCSGMCCGLFLFVLLPHSLSLRYIVYPGTRILYRTIL